MRKLVVTVWYVGRLFITLTAMKKKSDLFPLCGQSPGDFNQIRVGPSFKPRASVSRADDQLFKVWPKWKPYNASKETVASFCVLPSLYIPKQQESFSCLFKVFNLQPILRHFIHHSEHHRLCNVAVKASQHHKYSCEIKKHYQILFDRKENKQHIVHLMNIFCSNRFSFTTQTSIEISSLDRKTF